MLKFIEDGHKYEPIDGSKDKWTSVTTAVHHFCQPFDTKGISQQVSKKKTSKWYGMTTTEIENQWKETNTYSLKVGNWYHTMMEKSALSHETISSDGVELKIVKPIIKDGIKYAPDQKLQNNAKYPEHFCYLKSAKLCGQTDDPEVKNGFVNINDFKTNKEIKQQSYKHWETGYKMMKAPFQHLMDCNYYHYALQESLYMYMILKHNPQFKPGKVTLQHILFEEAGRDKFDNPIYREENGQFFIKDIQMYDLPYLKAECQALIEWLKVYQIPAKH